MADVNVAGLRQNLPAYLDRARRGELIRVVSRGTVIAEITAPKATEGEADLIRKRLRGAVVQYESPMEPASPLEDGPHLSSLATESSVRSSVCRPSGNPV